MKSRMIRSKEKSWTRADIAKIADDKPEVLTPQPIPEEELRDLHERHQRLMCKGVEALYQAMDIGDILLRWKEQIRYGQWLDWLKTNVQIPERTCQQYLRLATGRELIESRFGLRKLKVRSADSAEVEYRSADSADLESAPSIQRALFFLTDKGDELGAKPKPKPAKGPRYPKITLTPELLEQLCPDCRTILEGKSL